MRKINLGRVTNKIADNPILYTESQDGVGVLDTQVESAPSVGEQSSDTAAQQEEGAPNTDQDIANSSEQNGTASLNEAAAKGFAFISLSILGYFCC